MGEETGDVVGKGHVQYRTWRFILSAQYFLSISVSQDALSFIREMEMAQLRHHSHDNVYGFRLSLYLWSYAL